MSEREEIEEMAEWLRDGISYLAKSGELPVRDREQRIIAYQNALRAVRMIENKHRMSA